MVKVEDSAGNVVNSVPRPPRAPPLGGGIHRRRGTGDLSNGVATFSGWPSTASTLGYTLTFSGAASRCGLVEHHLLATGTATQLVITTQPSATDLGAALATQPVVKVEDSGGNVVTTAHPR